MNHKNTNILKKTIKITGLTCVALGGAALIASGAALKALTEGAKFLKDAVQEIIHEDPKTVETESEASAEEAADVPAEVIAEAEPVITAESCDEV